MPYHRFGNSKKFQHTAARRRLALNLKTLFAYFQVSTHSRPKAAGSLLGGGGVDGAFQHTAARRRLGIDTVHRRHADTVSTHSRPKAAGKPLKSSATTTRFQHTAARRRLDKGLA